MIVFGLKSNQRWKPIQMCLHFSLSRMLAHTHMQADHTLVNCRHDWKYRLCGKSDIVSVGLMNSGQNHFRQSQQRINIVIVINGNKIVFSPEIIIALSHLLCPVPTVPILLMLFLLIITLSSPSYCLHSSLFDPILFSLNLFIISFFPSHFKSNTSFKRESFSGKICKGAMCQLPLLSSPVIAAAATPQGYFIQNRQETKSPNRLSTEGSERVSGRNSVQSTIR